MHIHKLTIAVGAALAIIAGAAGLRAEGPSFKRVELQRHDLTASGQETIVARGEFQPGAAAPKHTHPGDEIGYILEGEITVDVAGQGPKTFKAGDTFFIASGTVHSALASAKTGATVLSTYILEKGKPLATPAK